MAFTKSTQLGFDLSVITGPLTQLATTAAGVYGQVATQQAQAKLAEAQAMIAKAQQKAEAMASTPMPGVPRPAGAVNWPLYLGIGGVVVIGGVLLLKKKR